jgi:hypothetical protein
MAISSASGWNNLPNGNFSPVIYSKKVQKAFRKSSVVEDITNTDYAGEIANMGDSVKIIKEPDITVSSYTRGLNLTTQALDDADFSLIVDQANYFQFSLDDVESSMSHVNFIDLATDRAAYKLRDAFDQDVLGYLAGWSWNGSAWVRRTTSAGDAETGANNTDELIAANKLDITDFGGSDIGGEAEVTSIPTAAGGGAGAITSPLAILNRMARQMDVQNVDTDGRWVVVDPVFKELLMDEDAKLVNADYGGDGEVRNGRMPGTIRGFRVYTSNNLPYEGTGPGTSAAAGSEAHYGVIVGGHDSAVAVADQIAKTESFRSPDSFSDVVRGLQLYGRKILRPQAIITANYNLA